MVAKGRQSKGEKSSLAAKKFHAEMKAKNPDIHHQKFSSHFVGTNNHNAKLTPDIVREIRQCNDPAKDLAAKFGVNRSVIFKVRSGEMWKHVI